MNSFQYIQPKQIGMGGLIALENYSFQSDGAPVSECGPESTVYCCKLVTLQIFSMCPNFSKPHFEPCAPLLGSFAGVVYRTGGTGAYKHLPGCVSQIHFRVSIPLRETMLQSFSKL